LAPAREARKVPTPKLTAKGGHHVRLFRCRTRDHQPSRDGALPGGATIEQYGGRFLVRAGATELIEGRPEPKRIVILEFADKAAFKRWYDSPEYQKILPGRVDNSTARAFIVEGVS
jgi:uncharacterized protein (DUF1330 family)